MHARYAFRDSMVDSLFSRSCILVAADMCMEYVGMKVVKLYEFVMFMFPCEEALEDEKNRTLWTPIFHSTVDKLDRRDRDCGVGGCSSTEEFLMDNVEKNQKVACIRVHAAMHVWLGMVCDLSRVGKGYPDEL